MADVHELVREMGCTEADFMRWLPGATRNAPATVFATTEVHVIRVEAEGGTVEIRLRPLPPRRLGEIALPVLEVRFRFLGLDPGQIESFLDWFDHYTRRGGG